MSTDAHSGFQVPERVRDAGLRCPRCDYNLTGLLEGRCPECGGLFEWDTVRREAENPPRIHFEKSRRWRKIPGLLVTWATVLFTPWIFARQIVKRVSPSHGLIFGGICFAVTFGALFFGADLFFMGAWMLTGLIYVAIQTVCLSVVDVSDWRRPLSAVLFWLVVGGYTSAVMMTEICYGPPLVCLSDLRLLLIGQKPGVFFSGLYELTAQAVVMWTQMALWLTSLGCILFLRLRRRRWPVFLVLPAAIVVSVGVLFLYATVVEYIGVPIGEWLADMP